MKTEVLPVRGLITVGLAALVLSTLSPATLASDLGQLLAAGTQGIKLGQASQARIDEIAKATRDLEGEYRQVLKELDGLEVYNKYMEQQVENQKAELGELRRSIDEVSGMERQIVPLMMRMLESLQQFVELDVPFLKEERTARVARLAALMEEPNVSVAEKFRRLTEAFQIENDFGRTIESYRETLTIAGATLEVSVLRIGRIGLYYQTGDGSLTGMWDHNAREWVQLTDSEARNQVRQGLRIARKQVAPDLLLLPVPAPEGA
jgi:hypothetical protein